MDTPMRKLDMITIATCIITIIFLILWIWCAVVQQGFLVKIYKDLELIIDNYVPPDPARRSATAPTLESLNKKVQQLSSMFKETLSHKEATIQTE